MKKKNREKTANPEQAPAGVTPDLEPAASAPVPTEALATAELTFEEALEVAGKAETAPASAAADPELPPVFPDAPTAETAPLLKEVKEKKSRKVAPVKAPEALKPVNRIEKEGADFRLFVATEPRGSYAFFRTAVHAFEEEVGRPPVKAELLANGDPKPETPPAVVNGYRIQAAEGGGWNVYFDDGQFQGWKKDLGEAEDYLARIKTKAAEKGTPAPVEESPKPAKTEAKTSEKPADSVPPTGETPSLEEAGKALAEHCAKTVRAVGVEAETERVRQSLLTLKALAADAGAGNPEALAGLLAAVPEDLFRAEAERRGLLNPAPKPANGNRGPANRAEHVELTKKAWVRARELAAAKGGKPQDHMKEAWGGLVRD